MVVALAMLEVDGCGCGGRGLRVPPIENYGEEGRDSTSFLKLIVLYNSDGFTKILVFLFSKQIGNALRQTSDGTTIR